MFKSLLVLAMSLILGGLAHAAESVFDPCHTTADVKNLEKTFHIYKYVARCTQVLNHDYPIGMQLFPPKEKYENIDVCLIQIYRGWALTGKFDNIEFIHYFQSDNQAVEKMDDTPAALNIVEMTCHPLDCETRNGPRKWLYLDKQKKTLAFRFSRGLFSQDHSRFTAQCRLLE